MRFLHLKTSPLDAGQSWHLVYVPHLILWTPSWAPRAGEQPEGQHGGPKQECQEELQSYIWHQNQVINIELGSICNFEVLLGTLVEV